MATIELIGQVAEATGASLGTMDRANCLPLDAATSFAEPITPLYDLANA
jgi:hypothetical protein